MLENQDIQISDRANRQSFFDNMKGGTFDTPSVDNEKILNADKFNKITSATDYGLDDLQTTALTDPYQKTHKIFVSYRSIDDEFIEDFNIVEAGSDDVYFKFAYNQFNTEKSQIMQFGIHFGLKTYTFITPVPAINFQPQSTTWRSFVSSVFNEMLNGHTMFRISINGEVQVWDMETFSLDFVPLVDSNNNFVYADTAIKNFATETYKPYVAI